MSGNPVAKLNGSGVHRNLFDSIFRPLVTSPARSSLVVFFLLSILGGAFLSTRFLDSSPVVEIVTQQTISTVTAVTRDTHPDVVAQQTISTADAASSDAHPHDKNTQAMEKAHTNVETPAADAVISGTQLYDKTNKSTQTTEKAHTKVEIPAADAVISGTQLHDKATQSTEKAHRKIEIPLDCSAVNVTQTCPTNYPVELELDPAAPPPPTCPDYFRWIYEDLRPWRETGITEDMVERAKRTANFKLVILNGKAYVERYQKAFQTRDVFTLWGFLQLLRKYPGRVPDLELMFDCVDWPVLQLKYFRGLNAPAPPPLFRYCGDDNTYDIVFPDWSFWGWAEINIKPWELLSKELKEGNKKMRWTEREPYAYWKGNPFVAPTRMDLLSCNATDKQDWHARVYVQNWAEEAQHGFKQSSLADQCIHRHKIYIEGSAWSVSEKYILACDSVSLIVDPHYYDFFSRSLMPMQHYWPISEDNKCRSIKYAVEWGDRHKQKAQAIGKAASAFILEDLKMDYIYDYMLHLLTEYAKLLKFKPTIPKNAVELCSETMACPAPDEQKKFMMQSLVKGPSDTAPCIMPPPYDPVGLQALIRRKNNTLRVVKKWEKEYWDN